MAKFSSRPLALLSMLCGAALLQAMPAAGDDLPSAASLIDALRSKTTRGLSQGAAPADTPAPNTEQMRLIETLRAKAATSRGLSVRERKQLASVTGDRPQTDIVIFFDYDSAAISGQSAPVLAELGKALSSNELKDETFLIGGHTDAAGASDYNQRLSERRARAVREYLKNHFNLPETRIIVVGYGEEQLKDPANPYAAVNRRVQVVNISGASASKAGQ